MPPSFYRPFHPETRLTREDVQALCTWTPEKP
jgi:hypothetical protein